MKYFKWTFISFLLVSVSGFLAYQFWFAASDSLPVSLYTIEIPTKREIKQIISATGSLKLKDQIRVGSLISGRIQKIHVKEHDVVEVGQLLAEIETGVGDTEVREAEGAYEKALAELDYQTSHYQRQQQLFAEHIISDAALQEAKRQYFVALADAKSSKAGYDKKLLDFQHHRLCAPTSGVVLHVALAQGERITDDLEEGTLLWLAPDVNQIEAELEINEKDIGQVQKGQKVHMMVETYPNRLFESTIHSISFIAKTEQEDECVYQAKAYIDNPCLLLRPGMTVQATIDVDATDSALALTSHAFLVKHEHLQPIAQLLEYSIQPIEKQSKQALLQEHADQNIQFVWRVNDHSFQEIPVEIGMTDNIYFEVKSGLNGDEQLVADIMAQDDMQKIYETLFRKL